MFEGLIIPYAERLIAFLRHEAQYADSHIEKGNNMKKIIGMIVLSACCTVALADNYVKGYAKKDGTYVQPHYQTAPDNSRTNNYSAQGNTNPYTGQKGNVNPYQPPANQYNQNPYGQQQRRSY